MKNKLFIAMLATAIGAGWSANAAITGSAHDFSGAAWSSGKICLPCHTPHAGTSAQAPLWNHATTTNSFILYSGSTLDASDLAQPTGESLACLSCHDGTVALDSFGGSTTGSTFIASINSSADVGTDLSNDHPISFTYSKTLATTDGSLHDPTVKTTSLGDTIQKDLLFSDKMECASCHDVHNADGNDGLLRIDNSGSSLCLTCHDK
jgi:predicted CXXCH cytochrome family protein